MQTLTLQVQDDFVPNLLNLLKEFKNEVIVKKDKNLEYDPYFYERQKQLQQDIDDLDNGKAEILSSEQFEIEMDVFFKDLKSNANI